MNRRTTGARPVKRYRRTARRLLSLVAAVTGALALAACGTTAPATANQSGTTPNSAVVDNGARALLPESIRSAGVIKDASSFDYPPFDMLDDSGNKQGIEVDMLNATAAVLGVQMDFQHIQGYASLVPAVTSGRVDMAGESIAIRADRLKIVSFTQYTTLHDVLLVRAGNPTKVNTADLCGHTVSVESGSTEVDLYNQQSKQCTDAGKPPVTQQDYTSEAAQLLSVTSGRSDAAGYASIVGPYIAKESNGKLEVAAGPPVGGGSLDIGFAIAKDKPGLGKAIAAALQILQKNGKLDAICKKWGMPPSDIKLGFQS